MKDDRSRAFAVLLALFLIGLILGVGGSYLYFKPSQNMSRFERGRFSQSQPQPQNGQRVGTPKPGIPEELNLTPEQEEKWEEIWKETGDKMESLGNEWDKYIRKIIANEWATWAPKQKNIWAENESRARAVLNEDQKAKFDVWIEKVHNYMESRRRGPEMPMENRPKTKRKPLPSMPMPGPPRQ